MKLRSFVCLLIAGTPLLAAAAPKLLTGAGAEVTADGLYRIDQSVMAMAWARPGVDLRGYSKVMVTPSDMTFKSGVKYPLSERQKQQLRTNVVKTFTTELGKHFTLTDQPGPGVLEVRGALLNIESYVPPDPVGRGAVIAKTLGEATLVVELRDSQSSATLARAVDRRAVASSFPRRINAVSNGADVQGAVRDWAKLLSRRLTELHML